MPYVWVKGYSVREFRFKDYHSLPEYSVYVLMEKNILIH